MALQFQNSDSGIVSQAERLTSPCKLAKVNSRLFWGVNQKAETLRRFYCQYFVKGLKVYEKTLAAAIMPLLGKMSFCDRAVVWVLVNGACPGFYLEMQTDSFSGTLRLHCCLF